MSRYPARALGTVETVPHLPGITTTLSPKKIAVAVLGAVLVLAGIAALLLPGPGLLLILLGLIVWAWEFEWAAARVERMREKALTAAKTGVETVPRIVASTLSALAVIGIGVVWGLDPEVDKIWIIGPGLPFGGWGTGVVMILGGVVALGLLVWSVVRFRYGSNTASSTAARQRV